MQRDPVSTGNSSAPTATVSPAAHLEATIQDAPTAGLTLDFESTGLLAANASARQLLDRPEAPFAPGACLTVQQC